MVTVPLKNYRAVPVEPLAGKIVIDTNNYYPQRGWPHSRARRRIDHHGRAAPGTSASVEGREGLQPYSRRRADHRWPARRHARIAAHWRLPETMRAAKATVTRLLDQFGFDMVDAGPLKEGWRIQRDTPGYGPQADSRTTSGPTSRLPRGIATCELRALPARSIRAGSPRETRPSAALA